MRIRFISLSLVFLAIVAGNANAQFGHQHDDSLDGHAHAMCGTSLWIRAHDGKHPELQGLLASLCDSRVLKQANTVSPGGHFRIHYDRTGADAVAAKDSNANNVPDYIDSVAYYLEYAWTVEIDQYGFLAPPPDNRGPGPETDVYICNLPSNIYGLTVPEADNPTGTNTLNGFMTLDNDYAGYPTPGIQGLAVTSAHEFNHLVQFSRYRYDRTQTSLYEMTSVWFERQVHPDIPDYLQYVRDFLGAPQNYSPATHKTAEDVTGYCHVIYFDYLAKRFGRDIVRSIWEKFADQPNCFTAMDLALRDNRWNLESSYCEFALWCYYTGARAQDTTYLPEARFYPTMRVATQRTLDSADAVIGMSLYPLSFGIFRVLLPQASGSARDTVDFLVTDARTDFGIGGPGLAKNNCTLDLSKSERDGYTALEYSNGKLYFRLTSPTSQFCVTPLLGGQQTAVPSARISPQPYLCDGGSQMLFGINLAKEQVTHATLWIYSSSAGRVVELERRELDVLNNQLGVAWDGRDRNGNLVPSGVYLYELSINQAAPLVGKFVVVRK